MEFIYDVNSQTFEENVIRKSYEKPVAVDFWAPWCAPCRSLKPILESVTQSFGGDVVLAKLNTEEEPELATDYGIRGIPNVKIFKDGEVVDEFTGLIPEEEIRSLLGKYIKTEVDLFLQALKEKTIEEKIPLFESKLIDYGANLKYLFEYGKALFEGGQSQKALEILKKLPKLSEFEDQVEEMKVLHELASWSQREPKDKYEIFLVQAGKAIAEKRTEDALNFLIDLLYRKKDYLDGGAKKMALALIHQCRDEENKSSFFRRLSMAILG